MHNQPNQLNQKPFLQCIVLSYKGFEQTTKKCLDSIIPQLDPLSQSILVLDNGSPDDTPERLRAYVRNSSIDTIFLDENLGFAGGMNHAVNNTSSEWVLLIGSDTQFHPQALAKIDQAMKNANPDWGLICPVTNEAGTAQRLQFNTLDPEAIFKEFDNRVPHQSDHLVPIYRADFFCVGIRRSLWEQISGLNLSYGKGYYEDFDFCMQANEFGFKCMMVEDSFIFHQGSATFKLDSEQKALLKKNKKIFKKKFPKAELRHRRLDNLKVLQSYLVDASFIENKERHNLIAWRLEMLDQDQPRSLWKKEVWKNKVQRFKKQLKNYEKLIQT